MKIPADTKTDPADYTRTLRRIVVPVQMTMADVLVPGNWAHLSGKIFRNDEVIVVPEDGSWRMHLYVVETGAGYVKTVALHQWERPGSGPLKVADDEVLTAPDGYRIDHTPKTGWRAFTTDPHIEIARNKASRNDAIRAAIAHAAKAAGV